MLEDKKCLPSKLLYILVRGDPFPDNIEMKLISEADGLDPPRLIRAMGR